MAKQKLWISKILMTAGLNMIKHSLPDDKFETRIYKVKPGNTIYNCAWHEARYLNKRFGIKTEKDLARLKMIAVAPVPEKLKGKSSKIGSWGYHAGISNRNDKSLAVTWEPKTNVLSIERDDSDESEAAWRRTSAIFYGGASKEEQETIARESLARAKEINEGASQYYPSLAGVDPDKIQYRYGWVITSDANFDAKRQNGLTQNLFSWMTNLSAKMVCCVENAAQSLDLRYKAHFVYYHFQKQVIGKIWDVNLIRIVQDHFNRTFLPQDFARSDFKINGRKVGEIKPAEVVDAKKFAASPYLIKQNLAKEIKEDAKSKGTPS